MSKTSFRTGRSQIRSSGLISSTLSHCTGSCTVCVTYTHVIRRYWDCFHSKNLPTYTTICRSEAVASIFPSGENLATLTAD
jgi:hypothetical protein